MEGIAYRGRVLLEINMEIGKLPNEKIVDLKVSDLNKLAVSSMTKFLLPDLCAPSLCSHS